MDIVKIEKDLYDLVDEIKETKEYKELKESFDNLYQNDETIQLIKEFNLAKDNYSLNESKENINALSLAKAKLYSHPLYISYSNKLISYNKYIEEIEKHINKSLYGDEVLSLVKEKCNGKKS